MIIGTVLGFRRSRTSGSRSIQVDPTRLFQTAIEPPRTGRSEAMGFPVPPMCGANFRDNAVPPSTGEYALQVGGGPIQKTQFKLMPASRARSFGLDN
jgi:hypothetical protein